MPTDRNLGHLYPEFRSKVVSIITELQRWCDIHIPGAKVIMTEGYRTAQYQHQLYEQGRSTPGNIVTYKDGYIHKSKHQSSLASDIMPELDGKLIGASTPEGAAFYAYLQHMAHVNKLESGADWTSFKDLDHIQEPAVSHVYIDAAAWQKEVGLGG